MHPLLLLFIYNDAYSIIITALLQRLDGSKLTLGSEAPAYAVYLLKDGAFLEPLQICI